MANKKHPTPDKPFQKRFLELCNEGKSLTQIARTVGVLKEKILDWSKSNDPKRADFVKVFKIGKQACQAYHEDLYDQMSKGESINGIKPDAKSKELHMKRMTVMFKEDWQSKDESTLEVKHTNTKLSKEQMAKEILKIMKKINKNGGLLDEILPPLKPKQEEKDNDQLH